MTSTVGQSVAVIDATERVTGSIGYVLDLELPRMAHGRILRSPHPHARILSIDTARAESLSGVFAVITARSLDSLGKTKKRYGRFLLDQAILAEERVRYVGEPVAAVAASSEELAEAACQLIDVEYEPLPAVFDVEEALEPDAVLLHEPRPALRDEFRSMFGTPSETSNLCTYFRLRQGVVEQGFAESDFVFSDTFRTPAVQHVPLEPHVAVASYDTRLTVWSSTQMPHAIRAQLADLLDLSLADVRVITSNLGGGFGAKGSLRLEPIASMLALCAQRPVKIVLERDEEFVTVTKHPSRIEIKSGVTRDGLLLAREVTAYYNTGAYADVGPMVARNAGSAIIGPYRIPHVKVDSFAVWSNLVPAGAFRGFGVAQGAWAYESHTDMIAKQLDMDPVEFRRQNLLRDGDRYATGEQVHDIHFDRLLDRVAHAIDWSSTATLTQEGNHADGPKRRGRAIVTTMKATITPSTSTAAIILNEDGSVNVMTSSVDLGQGVKTVLAQLAADCLQLPYESVHVSEPDTDVTPYDQQTSSSRSTYSMGNSVLRAGEDVKRQLLELAAEHMEASSDDMVIDRGTVQIRGVPSSAITYDQLIREGRRGNLQGTGSFITEGDLNPETGQGTASVHWHHGASSCEVEVDIETGKVEIPRFASAVFAGRIINPRLCELQVEGSVLFGLGQALFEEIAYEDGQIVNANLSEYMIPSFVDVPGELDVALLESEGRGEIHGVGETSLPQVSPVVASAIRDAVGVHITELPITPERVLRALGENSRDSAQPGNDVVEVEPVEVGG